MGFSFVQFSYTNLSWEDCCNLSDMGYFFITYLSSWVTVTSIVELTFSEYFNFVAPI